MCVKYQLENLFWRIPKCVGVCFIWIWPLHDQIIFDAEDFDFHCRVITLWSNNIYLNNINMSLLIYLLSCNPWQTQWLQGMLERCEDLILRQWVTAGEELIGYWKKWKGRDLNCVHESSLCPPPSHNVCFCLAGWRFTELHSLLERLNWAENRMQTLQGNYWLTSWFKFAGALQQMCSDGYRNLSATTKTTIHTYIHVPILV